MVRPNWGPNLRPWAPNQVISKFEPNAPLVLIRSTYGQHWNITTVARGVQLRNKIDLHWFVLISIGVNNATLISIDRHWHWSRESWFYCKPGYQVWHPTLSKKNHWMNEEIPRSRCCKVKSLVNGWKFSYWASKFLIHWLEIQSVNKDFTLQHRDQGISSFIQLFFIESEIKLTSKRQPPRNNIFLFIDVFGGAIFGCHNRGIWFVIDVRSNAIFQTSSSITPRHPKRIVQNINVSAFIYQVSDNTKI